MAPPSKAQANTQNIGRSKGGTRDVCPWGSKFFHVHAVFSKYLKNNVTLQAGTDQIATGCHGRPPVQDSRIGELLLNKLQLKLQMFYWDPDVIHK